MFNDWTDNNDNYISACGILYISYKINIIYTTMMTDADDIYILSQYD